MPVRCYTKDDYRRVKELRDRGLKFREIAPLVGITKQLCSWLMTRWDRLPETLPSGNKEERKESIYAPAEGEFFTHDPYYNF